MDLILALRSSPRLAFLEGSRLEAEGDLAGAWGWYRAALRSSRHCGKRGSLIERLIGTGAPRAASTESRAWAQLPGVDANALRRALNEVQAIDAMTPPMSDTVKCEYLSFQEAMARPDMLWKFLEAAVRAPNSPTPDTKTYAKTALLRAEAFLKRDPERSRRLLKLAVANWLAYCDRPSGERPPLDPRRTNWSISPGRPPPPNARLLTPDRLNSWSDSSIFFHNLFPALDASRNAIDRERATQAALVVHLASELYRREHGEPPDSPKELVGPYLKELPPDRPGNDPIPIDSVWESACEDPASDRTRASRLWPQRCGLVGSGGPGGPLAGAPPPRRPNPRPPPSESA